MKRRTDYITNSSSSSFILAFKDEEKIKPWGTSWDSFKEYCEEMMYDEFFVLISNLKEQKESTDKQEAINILTNYYSWNKRREIVEEHFANRKNVSFSERINFEKSEKCNNKIKLYLQSNDEYLEKKKQIEDADEIVSGMVWDSSGGIIEWAIRNGFIEDNFRNICVLNYNVG